MQIILNKYWEDRWIKAGVHGGNGWATKATNHVDLPNQSEQTLNENESQGFKKQNTELQWTRFPPLEQNTNLKTKCCRRQYISIKISESFLLPFPSLWDPMFISKQGHYTPPYPQSSECHQSLQTTGGPPGQRFPNFMDSVSNKGC